MTLLQSKLDLLRLLRHETKGAITRYSIMLVLARENRPMTLGEISYALGGVPIYSNETRDIENAGFTTHTGNQQTGYIHELTDAGRAEVRRILSPPPETVTTQKPVDLQRVEAATAR